VLTQHGLGRQSSTCTHDLQAEAAAAAAAEAADAAEDDALDAMLGE